MEKEADVSPKKKTRIRIRTYLSLCTIIVALSWVFFFFIKNTPQFKEEGAVVASRAWEDLSGSVAPSDFTDIPLQNGSSSEDFAQVPQENSGVPPESAESTSNYGTDDTADAANGDAASTSLPVAQAVSVGDNGNFSADASTTSAATSSLEIPSCPFPSFSALSRKIILNEIAWMGSPSSSASTSAAASREEWIEIKNISSGTIDLSEWQVENHSGKIDAKFSPGDSLAAGSVAVLVRAGLAPLLPPGTLSAIYSGDLSNAGDMLAVLDGQCNVSDALDASGGWPAGNNTTKQTMERDMDGEGWHTSATPGGTPGKENSIAGNPASISSSSAVSQNQLTVAFQGDGSGTIESEPEGLSCGVSCVGIYASGTSVTLRATASQGSEFVGWSDPCEGAEPCIVSLGKAMFLSAYFRLTSDSTEIESSGTVQNNQETQVVSSSTGASRRQILIAAIQIGGASSSNDFVKLFNPGNAAVDIGGWKLHKKSSSGTDYSLKAFSSGASVPAGGFFVWANSEGGFAASVGADTSSSETLATDNSVALFDENGESMDEVAWGTGADQYKEGSAFPTNPIAGQLLLRKSAGGVMADTGNNADDFMLE